jgi:RNA polymerase sigma-70 factor (ECF subfamily)
MDQLTRRFLAARDGARVALTQAIRASEADVWRLAAHLVGRDEADDVTQDTFVRAWRALPRYRGDSSARTWLIAIARRACADAVRRKVRHRRLLEHARADAALRPASRSADAGGRELDARVATLDTDQRAAFVLTQVLGFSYAEAAQICDVKIGTIRTRVARAREHLVETVRAAETG